MRDYSKNIYPREAIAYASDAYTGLCAITVQEERNYWRVCFNECKEDKSLIIREFSNFLIEIVNGVEALK